MSTDHNSQDPNKRLTVVFGQLGRGRSWVRLTAGVPVVVVDPEGKLPWVSR